MPPPVAACLFVAFICWLFYRDAKEFGRMSPALWIPFIWVSINASRPLVYWFSSGTAAAEASDISEGNAVDRNVYIVLIALGLIILARRRIQYIYVMRSCRWLWILYVYYFLSVLWSDYPFIAFKRWFKDAGDLVMVLILLTEADPMAAIRAVFVRSAYVLVPVSVLFIKWYPALGRYTHRWTYQTYYSGVTTNKNSLGQLAMLGGLFLLWQMVDVYRERDQSRRWRSLLPALLVFSMCLWILSLAGSATALVCFSIGTAILVAGRLTWVKVNLRQFGWGVAIVTIFMVAFTVSSGFRGVIAGALGRDATLTDRTLIWDAALESGSNPIIGCGFDSYWLTPLGDKIREEFHVEYAHNGYLEAYLHTGLVGLFLLAIMLCAAGRNAALEFRRNTAVGYLFAALFWLGVVFNYTEIAFGRSNVLGLLFSLMAAYGYVSAVMDAERYGESVGPTSRFESDQAAEQIFLDARCQVGALVVSVPDRTV